MDLIVKEYLGSEIEFKKIDGKIYANATSIAKAFENGSQKLSDWKRSPRTIELIGELEAVGNSHSLIISEEGRNGGTWIEENLLLDFASYLSVKFKVWMNTQITTLLREGEVSLKPKTEEEMLLELFPKSDQNLILLTAQNIREVKTLTKEIIYKEDIIIGFTKDIDLETKRKVLNNVVKHKGANYSERWSLLYKHFEDKFGVNLKRRRANFDSETKPKSKSMLDFIDRGMGMVPDLYEIATKLFEGDIKEILEHYNNIR